MKKTLFSLTPIALSLVLATTAWAAPSVRLSGNTVSIQEAVTNEMLPQIKESVAKVRNPAELSFYLAKLTQEEFNRIISLYPAMSSLRVEYGQRITDLSGLAKLKKLNSISLSEVSAGDFTPLAGLTSLQSVRITANGMTNLGWMKDLKQLRTIEISSSGLTDLNGIPSLPLMNRVTINKAAPNDLTPLVEALPNLTDLTMHYIRANDLSPLAKLTKMKSLSLYGAEVADFSPLAQCPALVKLDYYASKTPDFSALGKLTQVKEFHGGLTKLDSISWLENLPNLESLTLFAEPISDYTPLTKSKLQKLKIWSMRKPVGDLTPVSQIPTLKELVFWTVEGASNSKQLAALTNLDKVEVRTYNKKGGEPFDLSAANGWDKAREVTIHECIVANADGLAGLKSAARVRLTRVTGPSDSPVSVAAIAKNPVVRYVDLYESNVTDVDKLAESGTIENINLAKVRGVKSIAALQKMPALRSLTVTKGAFPEEELAGFAKSVRISQR